MTSKSPQNRFLISIIVPTFNHASFLKKSLNSVANQTYLNWELIVIDNYSTDETSNVVDDFITNNSNNNISYLKIHNNGVIAKSRNEGIKIAKGDWIAFLDSDDWWEPNKLELISDYLNESNDLIYHDLEIVYKMNSIAKKRKLKSRILKTPVLIDLVLNGNPIANSSVVVRKKLLQKIGGLNESQDMIAAEDYNAWMRIAYLTDSFKHVPKVLGFYLIHDIGISQKDMSNPARKATSEFLSILNNKQKKELESYLSYVSGSFKFSKNDYFDSRKSFLLAKKNGNLKIKIKSYIFLFMILVKQISGGR